MHSQNEATTHLSRHEAGRALHASGHALHRGVHTVGIWGGRAVGVRAGVIAHARRATPGQNTHLTHKLIYLGTPLQSMHISPQFRHRSPAQISSSKDRWVPIQ